MKVNPLTHTSCCRCYWPHQCHRCGYNYNIDIQHLLTPTVPPALSLCFGSTTLLRRRGPNRRNQQLQQQPCPVVRRSIVVRRFSYSVALCWLDLSSLSRQTSVSRYPRREVFIRVTHCLLQDEERAVMGIKNLCYWMEPISSVITTYCDRPSCQPSHVTDQTPADAAWLGLPIYVMCLTALAARSRFRIPIDTLSGDYRLNPLTSSPFNFLAQPNPPTKAKSHYNSQQITPFTMTQILATGWVLPYI